MLNSFKMILVLLITSGCVNGQCNLQPIVKNPQSPDPCQIERTKRPFPVSYAPLREADVMWSKRTWCVIDLREKLNLPLYYPQEPKVCLMSLFDVLKCAILEGGLTAFDNAAFDDEFTDPMTKEEVRSMLITWDSTTQIENVNDPGNTILTPTKTEITSSEIQQYWIKEDWFFDKQRSVMEARIIGICPLIQKRSSTGEIIGVKPLFWIYFPEARKYFVRSAVFNRWNDHERMNYDELFEKRMFSGHIYKESNVYDRSIAEYKTGTDGLLESEEIKENIFKYESNLWHY
jgi:gliding motility associated protien GldN